MEFSRSNERRTLAVIALASAGALALSACGSEYDVSGQALKGADGKTYVIPADAHRAVYGSKQDCLDDVTAHETEIKQATGEDVKPEDVCQPVTKYHGTVYPRTYYLGYTAGGKQGWESNKAVTWTPVTSGNFAAKGETLQHNEAEAPAGVHEGQTTTVQEHEGGFHIGTGVHEGGEGGVHEGGVHTGTVHEGSVHVGHVGHL